jgi:ankyrin repeat protein
MNSSERVARDFQATLAQHVPGQIACVIGSPYGMMMCACAKEGDVRGVRQALAQVGPAAVNWLDTDSGLSALHCAAAHGRCAVIELLAKECPNTLNLEEITGPEEQHMTALMMAAAKNKPHALVALVQHGAKLEGVGREGITALITAAKEGHLACCAKLLELGAKVDSRTTNGCSALFTAAQYGKVGYIPHREWHRPPRGATQ